MTHQERQAKAAQAAFAQHAERSAQELLSLYEERNLSAAMASLRGFAGDVGILTLPLDDWPKEARLRFFAMVIRAANPLHGAVEAESYRQFNDEIPF